MNELWQSIINKKIECLIVYGTSTWEIEKMKLDILV